MSKQILHLINGTNIDPHEFSFANKNNKFIVYYKTFRTRFIVSSDKYGFKVYINNSGHKMLRLMYVFHVVFKLTEKEVRVKIDLLMDPTET